MAGAFRAVVRVAAATLGVERASVWLLSEDHQSLRCAVLYSLSSGTYSQGLVLSAREYPKYFEALASGRAIDAGDARHDSRTSEFREHYLEPLGITSMMDAAVRHGGRIHGLAEVIQRRRRHRRPEDEAIERIVAAGEGDGQARCDGITGAKGRDERQVGGRDHAHRATAG